MAWPLILAEILCRADQAPPLRPGADVVEVLGRERAADRGLCGHGWGADRAARIVDSRADQAFLCRIQAVVLEPLLLQIARNCTKCNGNLHLPTETKQPYCFFGRFRLQFLA